MYIKTISGFLFQGFPNAVKIIRNVVGQKDHRIDLRLNCRRIIELVYEENFPVASYLLKRTLSKSKSEVFKLDGPALSDWEKSKALHKIKQFSNLFGIFSCIGFRQFFYMRAPPVVSGAVIWIKQETNRIVKDKLDYIQKLMEGKKSYEYFLVDEFQDFIYLMEKTMYYGKKNLGKKLNHQKDVIFTVVPFAFECYQKKQNIVLLKSVKKLLNPSHMMPNYSFTAFVAKQIFKAIIHVKRGSTYNPSKLVWENGVTNTSIHFEKNLYRTITILNDQWESLKNSVIGNAVYFNLQILARQDFVNGQIKDRNKADIALINELKKERDKNDLN